MSRLLILHRVIFRIFELRREVVWFRGQTSQLFTFFFGECREICDVTQNYLIVDRSGRNWNKYWKHDENYLRKITKLHKIICKIRKLILSHYLLLFFSLTHSLSLSLSHSLSHTHTLCLYASIERCNLVFKNIHCHEKLQPQLTLTWSFSENQCDLLTFTCNFTLL